MNKKVKSVAPDDVIDFWLGLDPRKWFAVEPALDAEIRRRFEAAWHAARAGKLADWELSAEGALALVILLDQFPRNMFRGKAGAFASDAQAREVAHRALDRGYDMGVGADRRAFFYLPFMHSEDLADQDFCVALIAGRLGTSSTNHPFALGHRDLIRRFGRFPARNAALGRRSTAEETAFLKKSASH